MKIASNHALSRQKWPIKPLQRPEQPIFSIKPRKFDDRPRHSAGLSHGTRLSTRSGWDARPSFIGTRATPGCSRVSAFERNDLETMRYMMHSRSARLNVKRARGQL